MEVIKDKKNELFKRQELSLVVDGDKNPGFSEVRKMISEKVGKPEENIDVLKVEGSFGQKKFDVEAYVYNSKEDLDVMGQLRLTKKQKDEAKKVEEEAKKVEEEAKKAEEGAGEQKSERGEGEKPTESDSEEKKEERAGEDKKEEAIDGEKSESEVPVEERPEEEKKADREEIQGEEESKE